MISRLQETYSLRHAADMDIIRGKAMIESTAHLNTERADARLKDDLVREKAILVQELQHRIANSLQIIASVLMQSARRVQSEEARGHLHNAHHRVMPIAAVQKLLSTSAGGQSRPPRLFHATLRKPWRLDDRRRGPALDIGDRR